ncbi:hypothetical protein PMAYCL1PPCAC_12374 [Pristionchus mayeri]|uniref:Pseudouridine synthase RsuA/RluA-like domain-containing protein n=1 Tax=Pristionchus mayeri TaxID=1317129 RepID=A0AAN4ZMW9_9BILA|nr:hypothetical protein PMAYCL1PPCAC_12374 [Pristionchus mayeri]
MSAHDDFFGIEYIQSTSSPSEKNREKKGEGGMENSEGKKSVEGYSVVERRELTEMETEKMSGTQFLDASFFPELKEKNEESNWKKGEEGTKNIWEEQYFQRRENDHDRSRMKVDEIGDKERPTKRSPRVVMPTYETSEERRTTGLDEIKSEFFPFWLLSEDQLVEALCRRVIYNDGEMLAIDKPKGLACSGGSDSTKYQLDRLASKVKGILLPKCERLHPVITLDKDCSGIVLFSSNPLLRSELVERMKNGEITIKSDCIVRGFPSSPCLAIQTPLVKSTQGGQLKMYPAKEGDRRGVKVTSMVKSIKGNDSHSHVEVETCGEIPHQIRAHLSLVGLPLLGDQVYGKRKVMKGMEAQPMRYPSKTLEALGLSRNQSSKFPMFIHRREMFIPSMIATKPGVSIMAPVPPHFTLLLKKLSLLRNVK